MHKIIVVGGGGHAKVIISILKKQKIFEISGYVDFIDKGPILGVPYLGDDNEISGIIEKNSSLSAVIGIGSVSVDDALKRRELFQQLSEKGIDLPVICSPSAIINEDVLIGKGTVIADSVVINSGSKIGEGVIVNTNSSIDHDCVIGNFVHIAPGSTLSGGIRIGNNTLIGTGASVIQSINITENTIVGAGSVVAKDIKESGTYFGVPVRRVR